MNSVRAFVPPAPGKGFFDNYKEILFNTSFLRYMLNTLFYAAILIVAGVIVNGLAGYALAKIKFPFRDRWLAIIMMLMIIPTETIITINFMFVSKMDHASAWSKFKNITLPELKPLCVFVFITVTIGAFRMIVQPMVMTGGGPSHSTYTIVYDIYETGTVNWEIGLASAMAIVFTVFVVILTIIQTLLTKDKEEKHENKKAKNH
jgi:ABC-type sugar transport system permease subunit